MATPTDEKSCASNHVQNNFIKEQGTDKTDKEFKQGVERIFIFRGSVFLIGVAGIAMLSGFGMTLARTKRRSPIQLSKGVLPDRSAELHESGAALAMRALGWGSLFAVSGVGILVFGALKLIGVHNVQEFRERFQSVAPTIKRNDTEPGEDALAQLKSDILGESER